MRRELVAKPDARRTSLWISARSPHWDVRRNVAAHPATPARRLVGLAKDGSWSVRAAVATNVAAPSKAIQRLLTDHPAVRLELATNPSLSTAVVDMLLGDPDTSISGIASGHPEASPDALGRLLDRDDTPPWIRARIAKSPACPAGRRDEILTWVALGGAGPGDPTFDPRTCMVNPIDATRPVADFVAPIAPTLTSPLWPVRLAMLRQVRAPEASLHRVAARDISPNVRRRAAEFRSRSTLLELSGDRDALVRSAAQRLGGRVGSMRPRRVPVVIGGLAVAVLLAVVAEWDASTGSDSSPPVTLPFTVPEDLVLGPGESRRSATQVVPNVATIALETFGGLASVRIDALTPLTVISIDGLGVSDLPAHVSVGETRSWLGANLDSTRIRVEVDGIVSEYTIAFASDSPNDTSVKEVSGVRGVDSDG